ncbi:MAG TPA: peptidase M35, partial [Acidobacteria bacterium]|nr:peptidase M35 [Acidobacteriota bacterium]
MFAMAAASHALKARLDVNKTLLGETDDLIATVTVTNDTGKAVFVPKWQMPSQRLEGDLFEITQNGHRAEYIGRVIKRAAPAASDYVRLAPGASIQGQTELSRHYDLLDGGEYLIAFRMNLGSELISELRRPSDVVRSEIVSVWRDAPVRVKEDLSSINVMVGAALSTVGCGSSDNVTNAFNAATTYATNSKNYMQTHTASNVGPRYTTWFGTPTTTYVSTVTNHFVKIEDAFLNKAVTINCTCTDNYYAYVYKNQPYIIYVCNAYRSAPTTGTDSKAGTLIHEMSHFTVVADTDDWAYGQTSCKKLATRETKSTDNADSH